MNVTNISSGVPQTQSQTIANNQSEQIQPGQSMPSTDGQNEILVKNGTQVSVDNLLKPLLEEFVKALEQRTTLVQSLPQDIKEFVLDILQQNEPTADLLSQGMVAFAQNQKNAIDQLQTLANMLNDSLELTNQTPKELLPSLSTTLLEYNLEHNADDNQPPQVKESDIMSLAKQLINRATVETKLNSAINQLFKQGLSGTDEQQYQQLKDNVLLLVKQMTENSLADKSAFLSGSTQQTGQQTADINQEILQLLPNNIMLSESQSPENGQLTENSHVAQFAPNTVEDQPEQLRENAVVLSTGQQAPDKLKQIKQGNAKPVQQSIMEQQLADADGKQPVLVTNGRQLLQLRNNDIMSFLQQLFDIVKSAGVGNNSDNTQLVLQQMANGEEQLQFNENDFQQILKQMLDDILPANNKYQAVVRQLWQQSPLADGGDSLHKEQLLLRELVNSFRQSAPPQVQQAANKNNLPELTDLWALLKLQDAAQWTDTPADKLRNSVSALRDLAASMQKSSAFAGEITNKQSTVSFTTPLYFGEGMQLCPAHIHIYHQYDSESNATVRTQSETWLRICMATENMGVVDTVFRLYKENQLNVRVAFPNAEAAEEFVGYIPAIQKSVANSSLKLVDISVVNTSGG